MVAINVIACDPGATGAFCVLKLDPAKQPKIYFIDNKKSLPEINDWLIDAVSNLNIRMTAIEAVRSVPQSSAAANFTFGFNVGVANTLLSLLPIGIEKVNAKVWQKFIGVPAKKKGQKRAPAELKKMIAEIAERLYPGCDIRGPKGGLIDGRSDALMIAHYCAHKYK